MKNQNNHLNQVNQWLEIIKPQNFSFQECLWFLDRNYDDCLHEVRENSIRKLLNIEGVLTLIEITENDNSLIINVLEGKINQEAIENFIKEWFDLERNIEPFYELLQKDEHLKFMPKTYNGLRLLGIPNMFEALCWSIIGQQINLSFAYKLKRKFTEKFGKKLSYGNQDYWLFPTVEIVANISVEDLRPMQFSERKAEYLIEIAKHFAEGTISKQLLDNQATTEAIKTLMNVRGIGEWTANYALMKSLKRLECVTYGDVGLYNALANLKGFPKRPTRQELDVFFKNFSGWEAYIVFYLWRSLSTK